MPDLGGAALGSTLVTAAQMRALEAEAAAAGVPERALMANAGLAAAQEAWLTLGAAEGREVLALVGPGNNGGDGLVAAGHLAAWGARVRVYLLRARPDTDPEWRALVEAGVPATALADDPGYAILEAALSSADMVLDALFGTGIDPVARPFEGDTVEVLARLAAARAADPPVPLIALDLPSGVDADTGATDPAAVAADTTVTFGYAKVGLYAMPGHRLAGRIVPVEIGLPAASAVALPFEALRLREVQAMVPPRPSDGHKGTFGTVMVAAGARRFPGAARLTAEAAARSGAGLVTLAMPAEVQPLLAALADATHEPLPSADGAFAAAAAPALLRALRASKARALLVGPGLGQSPGTRAFVAQLLGELGRVEDLRAVVLDADALNILATLEGWADRLTLPRILTPHPGEMARLVGQSVAAVEAHRLDRALALARSSRSVVVLKGACTIIAAPDGRVRISEAATSALAHAGSGDVLAGLCAGFVAQGLDVFDAASVAVYLHADAGRRVAEVYGDAATLASDLLRSLPEARKALERER